MWEAIVSLCSTIAPPFMVLYGLGAMFALGLLAASALWHVRWPRMLGWPLLLGLFVGLWLLLPH